MPADERGEDRCLTHEWLSSRAVRAVSARPPRPLWRRAEGGDTVVVTGRDRDRTHAVARDIGGVGVVADFEQLDSVRALADSLLHDFSRIDVLVNNAGGMYNTRALTTDGFERTMQTNYLAPVLLTRLLLPRLHLSSGRVLSTSSTANKQGKIDLEDFDFANPRWNSGLGAYGASKLGVNLFTAELARRSSVPAFAVHPGLVRTGLAPDWWVLKTLKAITFGRYGVAPAEGAAPLVELARDHSVPAPSGTYFDRRKADGKQGRQAADAAFAAALWVHTSGLLGLPADV
ncbi:SDR family NAD(P)-dependent oxidoreductase [Williamsia sp. M5A3_1d]